MVEPIPEEQSPVPKVIAWSSQRSLVPKMVSRWPPSSLEKNSIEARKPSNSSVFKIAPGKQSWEFSSIKDFWKQQMETIQVFEALVLFLEGSRAGSDGGTCNMPFVISGPSGWPQEDSCTIFPMWAESANCQSQPDPVLCIEDLGRASLSIRQSGITAPRQSLCQRC